MSKYTKSDIDLIFPYLTDVELAFLMLYNISVENLFDMPTVEGEKSDFEEGDNDVEVESMWGIKGTPYAISVFGNASVYREDDTSGSYDYPPEAGDDWLQDISIDTIYIDTSEDDGIEITKALVEEQGFSWTDMVCLAKRAANTHIKTVSIEKSLSTELKKGPNEIPAKLKEKVTRLLGSPSYRAAKNLGLI